MRAAVEARIETFRRLTRDEGLGYAAAARQMEISSTCAKNYEQILVERTGLTRTEHLFHRWQQLVASGLTKTEAAKRAGIARTTYFRWEREGGPRPGNSSVGNLSPSGTARAHAVQRAQADARIENFRRLTRDEGMSLAAAGRAMNLSRGTVRNYEKILTERTGKSRVQHLYDRLRELLDAGRPIAEAAAEIGVPVKICQEWQDTGFRPGTRIPNVSPEAITRRSASKKTGREERLQRFQTLTREQGLPFSKAAELLGVIASTASSYESELTERTGLTCRQHRQRIYQDLRAYLPTAEAAAMLKIHYVTGRAWDRKLGFTTTRPQPPQEQAP